jgi:hypothetical protein
LQVKRANLRKLKPQSSQSTWCIVDVSITKFVYEFYLECGLPPEYCEFGQKDSNACKEWLDERYPQLFAEIYGAGTVVVKKPKAVVVVKEE